jgi:hypothetical protein
MNSKLIATAVLSIAALTSASAFAQAPVHGDLDFVAAPATTSNVTRAQVQAEYFQAVKTGTATSRSSSLTFVPAVMVQSTTNRANVRAEAMAWVKTHSVSSIS